MRFTQSELELIGQCTAPDKVLALTELRAIRRETDDPLKKEIVEDTIDKLLEVVFAVAHRNRSAQSF